MNILDVIRVKDFKLFGFTIFSIEESKTTTFEHIEKPIKIPQEYYVEEFEV